MNVSDNVYMSAELAKPVSDFKTEQQAKSQEVGYKMEELLPFPLFLLAFWIFFRIVRMKNKRIATDQSAINRSARHLQKKYQSPQKDMN